MLLTRGFPLAPRWYGGHNPPPLGGRVSILGWDRACYRLDAADEVNKNGFWIVDSKQGDDYRQGETLCVT